MDGKRFERDEKNVPTPTTHTCARDETSRTIRLSVESLGQIHYASFSQDCVGSYLKYQMCQGLTTTGLQQRHAVVSRPRDTYYSLGIRNARFVIYWPPRSRSTRWIVLSCSMS